MSGRAPRVLVVEDDPVYAQAMKAVLKNAWGADLDVHWVDDLEAALGETRRETPDAIVLDLNLPDSRGFDTLRAMKGAAPESAIVVLTGTDDDEAAGAQALREGAQDYLVKGDFGLVALARSLRYGIERKRVEEELRVARVARPLVRELLATLARESGLGPEALQTAGRAVGSAIEVSGPASLATALRGLGFAAQLDTRVEPPRYEFVARDTLERRSRAGATTCHLTLGVLAGALSRLENGRRVLATETTCQSRGEPACVFVLQARE